MSVLTPGCAELLCKGRLLPITPEIRQLIFLSHHKCASSLLTTFLLRLSQANGLTLHATSDGNAIPPSNNGITHLANANYATVAPHLTGVVVHVIRNPLNVVQSAYHSHLRTHPLDGWPELARQREVLQRCSEEHGKFLTLAFVERDDFYKNTAGPLADMRHWDFSDPRIVTVRMEDFGENIGGVIRSAVGNAGDNLVWPDSDEFSFRRMSGGRTPGEVDPQSHYRSGSPDAWREELPSAIIDYIRTHYRNLLQAYYPSAQD